MTPERVLENYLWDLERNLTGVSKKEKLEFIQEIRTHILEQWQNNGDTTASGMLNTLEQFGDAQDIAQDVADRKKGSSDGTPPPWVAVILTIVFWPIGIVLAWLSPRWETRQKWIATLLPVMLHFGALALPLIMYLLPGNYVILRASNIFLFVPFILSPLASGIYLAYTVER